MDTPNRGDDYIDDVDNRWYWWDDWIEHLIIGAGSTAQIACLGERGGPLVVFAHNPHPVQVGVFSFILDNCGAAGAVAEMNGPQLAWIASWVPEVVQVVGRELHHGMEPGWPSGRGLWHQPGLRRRRTYHWNIWCAGPPPPPSPTHPTPEPGPEDPPPPGLLPPPPLMCPHCAETIGDSGKGVKQVC